MIYIHQSCIKDTKLNYCLNLTLENCVAFLRSLFTNPSKGRRPWHPITCIVMICHRRLISVRKLQGTEPYSDYADKCPAISCNLALIPSSSQMHAWGCGLIEPHSLAPYCQQSLSFTCSILVYSRTTLHTSRKIFVEHALHVAGIQFWTKG